MEKSVNKSLRDTDPQGRLDVMGYRLAELFVRRTVEPALGGRPLWDQGGLGGLVEAAIVENVPAQKITLVDVARHVGLLRRGGK